MLTTFPDPLAVTLAILRALVPDVAAGTLDPADLDPDTPAAPYVMVAVDAQSGRWPVMRSAFLRLVAYGGTPHASLALAARCEAALLAFPGSRLVRGFGEGTGPVPAIDPDTAAPMAAFTIEARLRPVQV